MNIRGIFKYTILLGWLHATAIGAVLDGDRFLWYSEPASNWETDVLAIGNGRIGAAIFGSGNEVITLNEDSIWSGPLQNRMPTRGLQALPKIRQQLVEDDITEATSSIMNDMMPSVSRERAYSYFGNLHLDFGHERGMTNYVRWLDTRQGNAGISYTYNGINYTRHSGGKIHRK
ncbi:Alpha-L-fucosidase 2 [Beauveria bassiana]|uniref:Alpha-L-fucosidase 2 n=1 Tax=Beauveria bassiana TaxID=176275 RepID=A0A2N6NWS0_BEABA|nr:Alpha-L-fucosidase 2 [Beauveria bassiana]